MKNEIKGSDEKMNCLVLEDNEDVSTDNQNDYENEQVTFQRDKENEGFFASLIKGSIEDGYHIIFLSTHQERKLKYLKEVRKYGFKSTDRSEVYVPS